MSSADDYVQPGEKIWAIGDRHGRSKIVQRAVVVGRIEKRDALGPNGAAFHWRHWLDPGPDPGSFGDRNEPFYHATLEIFEGVWWVRGWTNEARDALLAARALANEPT